MYDRMIGYLEKFLILHNNQFGFRLKHSTTHALVLLTDKMQRSIDNGTYSCGIFLDLCKAFNAVDHKISFRRFLSYLSNRKQCVSLLGTDGSD